MKPKQDQLILHKADNSGQKKFATFNENKNENRKVMFNIEIWAVQKSRPAPLLFHKLLSEQQKLYESFQNFTATFLDTLITPGADTLHRLFHISK